MVTPQKPSCPRVTASEQLDEYTEAERHRASANQLNEIKPAPDRIIALPVGWQGSELVVEIPDPLGDKQRFRLVVAGRPDPTGTVLASVYVPETIAREGPGFVTELLASIRAQ